MKFMTPFNKTLAAVFAALLSLTASAQRPAVEMADNFRAEGKIYVVVAVALTIFIGMAIYLFTIDRKITKLAEKETKES